MTRNKHMAALYVMSACICGCKEPVATRAGEEKGTVSPPETDTMMAISDTVEPVRVTSWQSFESYNGKYITETDMMQQEPLKSRLKLLLGNAVPVMEQRFEVTPPVEVEHDIVYNQGCRKHYCGADEAAIAIDMEKDRVYVGIAVNGIVKLYSEQRDTLYPDKLLRWKQKFEN